MEDSYRTVLEPAQAEIKIQKSKFIGSLFHCNSIQEAEEQLGQVVKNYFNATHNCYAYRIHACSGPALFHYSDAGEPSGTAGRPIYEVLCTHNLVNVGIVVTRYFGGIKLGTGGLARAYRDSARSVLEKAAISEILICSRYRLAFPLNLTNTILKTLSVKGVSILESEYTDAGKIVFDVRLSLEKKLSETLLGRTRARIELTKIPEQAGPQGV